MKVFCTCVFLAYFSAGFAEELLHPLSDEFIDLINRKQSTWKAGRNFEIHEYDLFKALASGVKIPAGYKEDLGVRHDENEDIPEAFDCRENWPECADIIGLIRDQSRCGSCWAVAAAGAMSDRICIHSNGTKKLLVSAQDILSCRGLGGCSGGIPSSPWYYWINGIVTGGLYNNTEQGCKSYFLPNCEDHLNNCQDFVNTPSCVKQCDNPEINYESAKTYGNPTGLIVGEKQIQLEIMKNGPVETTYIIFGDFANYKSGIYQRTAGSIIDLHAVRIIGWGVEDGVKYWTIANSWNERWGENGFFRIRRGNNECGIETYVTKGLPDFSKF